MRIMIAEVGSSHSGTPNVRAGWADLVVIELTTYRFDADELVEIDVCAAGSNEEL